MVAARGGESWAEAECSSCSREGLKCCGTYDDVCEARPDSSIVSWVVLVVVFGGVVGGEWWLVRWGE